MNSIILFGPILLTLAKWCNMHLISMLLELSISSIIE